MVEVEQARKHLATAELCTSEPIVASLFGAPSDHPLMPIGLRRLVEACHAAQVSRFGQWAHRLQADLSELATSSPERPQDLPLLMDGRRAAHPTWAKLVGRAEFSALSLELLGYELCLAFAQQRPVRRGVMDRVMSISMDPQALDHRYVARVEVETRRQCARREAGVSAQVLRVNSIVEATIAVEMTARDPEKRQAADGARTLPVPVVRAVASWLHQQTDATSIITMVGFMSGLTWDATRLVPFGNTGRDRGHVALVDVARGVFQVDLGGLLPSAKAREGCEEATRIVARPLPQRTAQLLREIRVRNPAANCLGDLLPTTSNRQEIGDFGRRVTISKFLASRGVAALEARLNRKVAAYCAGAFSLIGKSEHHYIKLGQDEVNNGCEQLYAWLSWTSCAKPQIPTYVVGSGVTPTAASVLKLEELHAGRVEQLRVARRTTLEALIEFHNSYCLFCIHRAAFFTLARAAEKYGFSAAAFHPQNSFYTLVDKRAGPFGCATPLAMPVCLTAQVELWRAHLWAMGQRLAKLGWSKQGAAQTQLHQALDGEDCSLFFQITSEDRVRVPGSVDIFGATDLKGDAYRHFVANELRAEGLQTEVIEAVSRHVVPHATVFSISSVTPPARWLRDAAQALDSLAARLGLSPIPGLRRVMR